MVTEGERGSYSIIRAGVIVRDCRKWMAQMRDAKWKSKTDSLALAKSLICNWGWATRRATVKSCNPALSASCCRLYRYFHGCYCYCLPPLSASFVNTDAAAVRHHRLPLLLLMIICRHCCCYLLKVAQAGIMARLASCCQIHYCLALPLLLWMLLLLFPATAHHGYC